MTLSNFSLIELTDQFMTRKQITFPRQFHFRPSEASCRWIDPQGEVRIAGTCQRAVFFRATGTVPGGSHSPYTEWIFALGKAVENILIEQWKQMGVWVANSVEFYWPEYNIKGELDCIVHEPGTNRMIVCEVKSFYGYQASRDLMGNTKVGAKPKTSQMLQTLVYLYRFQDMFPYAKMIYYARDSANRTEFDISLVKEGENQTRAAINGVIDTRFYVENILARYREVEQDIALGNVPPPDYELSWDDEKVRHRYDMGEVAKGTFEKWEKAKSKGKEAEIIGDWQCSYCQYKNVCYNQH
jgi:hypothetical protein